MLLSLTQVATRLNCRPWMLYKMLQAGLIHEPNRIGLHRAFREDDLPAIRAALIARGYLHEEAASVE